MHYSKLCLFCFKLLVCNCLLSFHKTPTLISLEGLNHFSLLFSIHHQSRICSINEIEIWKVDSFLTCWPNRAGFKERNSHTHMTSNTYREWNTFYKIITFTGVDLNFSREHFYLPLNLWITCMIESQFDSVNGTIFTSQKLSLEIAFIQVKPDYP